MNKRKKEQHEYNSYEAYKREFYPKSSKKKPFTNDDPYKLGVNMAKETLEKVKPSLPK